MNILVTAPYNKEGLQWLAEKFGKVTYRVWKDNGGGFTPVQLNRLLEETGADALITEHDEVTDDVIRRHPHLQFIGVCRGTPSNVAITAAKEFGIPVFHTPARNAQAVAELFVANVITFLRKTLPAIDWLKDRRWQKGAHASYLQFKGNELAGKTVGLVGFGAVGQYIARLVSVFPCKVLYYDPYINRESEYMAVSLSELFSSCDIVSVHLPVNNETTGMINKKLIDSMKPDAIFVNTARASVVVREDLLAAIEENRIAGAILDVFDNEPPDEIDYRLIDHPRVLATPHIAGATHEVEDHHVTIMNEKLLNWLREK